MKKSILILLNYFKVDLPIEQVTSEEYLKYNGNFLITIDVVFYIFYTFFEYLFLKIIQYFLNASFNLSIGDIFFLLVPLPFFILVEIGLTKLDFLQLKYSVSIVIRGLLKSSIIYFIEIIIKHM